MEEVIVAIALSLYAYNVSPLERAKKLYAHFEGNCMDIVEMASVLYRASAFAATELPYPTAKIYVRHAMERYGVEARQRAEANGGPWPTT